ncbi:T9SS type A sorting domain-containing protein, partial [bacterium]|nr:T9SS type A sorting domain-containing protein [bacterium]
SEGDSLWSRRFGTKYNDFLNDTKPLANGGLVLCGWNDDSISKNALVICTEDAITNSESQPVIPTTFSISVYPNPFNPVTTLTLSLSGVQDVEIGLYDITGRYMQKIAQGRMTAGEHSIQVDAAGLPSGVYFARVQAGAQTITKKLVLLK